MIMPLKAADAGTCRRRWPPEGDRSRDLLAVWSSTTRPQIYYALPGRLAGLGGGVAVKQDALTCDRSSTS